MLLNSVKREKISENLLNIYCNGSVYWVPSTVFTFPCIMNIINFPWDSHTCELILSSWVLPEDDLVFTVRQNWTYDVIFPNSEWEVKRNGITTKSEDFGKEVAYTVLTYTVIFQRRTGFFTYVITLPSILMSFMTVIVFCLPPYFEDKLPIGT